jgi:NAD(P)H dehydrogenase (quinone)
VLKPSAIFKHEEYKIKYMSKLLVTGATGHLGTRVVKHLLKRVPASEIIALARNSEPLDKITNLSDLGVEVRIGDYFNYDSLLKAFQGVEKVLLIGSHSFTDRFTQHYNVITAARQAGVRHVIYNSIMRKDRYFNEISDSDIFSEQTLKASGLTYTILYQTPYSETLHFYYGFHPYDKGIKLTAGEGKMAPVTRDDLAEAEAVILSTPGHENKSYTMTGSESISFKEIARTLQELKGKPVSYKVITDKEYVDMRVAEGIPDFVSVFALRWVNYINGGEYDGSPADIEGLLGRKTQSYREYLEENPDALEKQS